jgi:hypothetical protein
MIFQVLGVLRHLLQDIGIVSSIEKPKEERVTMAQTLREKNMKSTSKRPGRPTKKLNKSKEISMRANVGRLNMRNNETKK